MVSYAQKENRQRWVGYYRVQLLKSFFKPLAKKLHFFDWLVLAGIAAIIVFFFYLRAARKTEVIPVRILFSRDDWGMGASSTPFWLTGEIQPGAKAYNSLGSEVATVKEVDVVDTGGPYRNAQVVVDLVVTYDEKTKTYSYNFQPLQIGKSIDLAFEKGNVKGLVMAVAGEEIPFVEKRVVLRLKGILPERAVQFTRGLQAHDSSGDLVVTVENVRIEENRYYQFSSSLNRNIQVVNPDLRDVELAVTVKAFQNGPTFYYVNNAALKVGNEIWLEFPKVSAGPAIILDVE